MQHLAVLAHAVIGNSIGARCAIGNRGLGLGLGSGLWQAACLGPEQGLGSQGSL